MKAQALERRELGSGRAAGGADSDGGDDAQAAAQGPGPPALQEGMREQQQQQEMQEYCVESTGAKATLSSAKQLLGRFCSSLPSDRCAPRSTTHSRVVMWSCLEDERVLISAPTDIAYSRASVSGAVPKQPLFSKLCTAGTL
jgi:hypothetical protein